jgi:hypothetical protein
MSNKSVFKRSWDFLWNDESITGWLVSLVVIFIFIKFIFFPGISAALGTSLPLVVVESSSMSHNAFIFGEFDSWFSENSGWYRTRGINRSSARLWDLKSGLEKGDIAVIVGYRDSDPKVGDVIVFNAGATHPIIHRLVSIEVINGEVRYFTKGDGNPDQLMLDKNISRSNIIGHAVIKIPKIGWIKLFVVNLF